MTVISMKRSEALSWVRRAIENEKYRVAIDILDDLIKQEKEFEAEEQSNDKEIS